MIFCARALDPEEAQIATQLRREIVALERIAQELDQRTLEAYDRMVGHLGREAVEEMLKATAYLKDRQSALRRRSG